MAGTLPGMDVGDRRKTALIPARPAGLRGQPRPAAADRTARGRDPHTGRLQPVARRLQGIHGLASRGACRRRQDRLRGLAQPLQSHRPRQVALRAGRGHLLRELSRWQTAAEPLRVLDAGGHSPAPHVCARQPHLPHGPPAGGQSLFLGGVHRLGLRAGGAGAGGAVCQRHRQSRGGNQRSAHAHGGLWSRYG